MAEQKESSVLFSLKELMNLEEDRIKQEEDAKRAAEEAAVQARMEAERKARDEEEARLHAANEKRRQEEQRGREEAARLEAIHRAEIEKARLDAENAARMEQLRQQQEHEKHLHAMKHDKSKKRLVLIASSIGVLAVAGLIAGGVIINKQMTERKNLETQIATLQSQIDENNKHMADLNSKLASATTPEERAALEQQIQDAQQKAQELSASQKDLRTGKHVAVHVAPKHTVTKPKCNCTPGDPLCSCL